MLQWAITTDYAFNIMTNNDILRRLRYTLNFDNNAMLKVFASADHKADNNEVTRWLSKDTDERYKSLPDKQLAVFLNGLINTKRGKREGPQPEPESSLNNNIILRKLKIAFNLQSQDMLDVLMLANFKFGEHELSALFRKPAHKHYRPCKDQVLRNFLMGLQLKLRPNSDQAPW